MTEKFESFAPAIDELLKFPLALTANFFTHFSASNPDIEKQYEDISIAVDILGTSYIAMTVCLVTTWILAWSITRKVERPPIVDADTLHRYSAELVDGESSAAVQSSATGQAAGDRTEIDHDSLPKAWSRLSIWSFICGTWSIFMIPIIPAIVLGHLAIRKDAGTKRGLPFARIGLAFGWFFLAIYGVVLFAPEP